MSSHQRMVGATCAGCGKGSDGRGRRTVTQRDLGSADKWHADCYRHRLPVSGTFTRIGTGTSWDAAGTEYRVTLDYDGRTMLVPSFSVGSGWGDDTPTVRDVLDNLFSGAYFADESPWEMIAELGYDTADDIKRAVTEDHPAIVKQTAELRALLGADYDAIEARVRDEQ